MKKWTRHLYQPCLPLGEDGRRVTGSKEHIELSRAAATECMVLLKNDHQVLPLAKGTPLALFGKGTIDYVKGGGGSGDVTVAYTRNLYEGMKLKEKEGKVKLFHELASFYEENVKNQYAAGYEPGMTREPEVPAELVQKAKEFTDTAMISFSRFSGEGWDRKVSLEKNDALWEAELAMANRQAEVFPDGDFSLTAGEQKLVETVRANFKNIIVVLNVGGIVDTSWFAHDDKISAALLAWQGGMEGGLAEADLLCGDANPSGKLADTFAESLEDYPSNSCFHVHKDYTEYAEDIYVGYRYFETIPGAGQKVVYPFGHGLSYTDFKIKAEDYVLSADGTGLQFAVRVTNTGKCAGKEVVQLYFGAPDGLLGKPAKQLCAFQKTKLLEPQESEKLLLSVKIKELASYDDLGKIQKSAWLLEKGSYVFYVGNSVRNAEKLSKTYDVAENTVTEQLTAKLVPFLLKERMRSDGTMEALPAAEEKRTHSVLSHMGNRVTEGIVPTERARGRYYVYEKKEKTLPDVAEGNVSLEEFMEQLTLEEAIELLGGQVNRGVSNTFGFGNMPEHGIPEITTADGPAGLRILPEVGVCTTAWPCATMLACSFDPELAQRIGAAAASEVRENNIGVWLAPGVNIHRSPLCGRNFEYYSEDCYVSGKIGAAIVKGIQSQNIAATVKHFAFNNKETNRKNSDSRVSERAARELYLKAFEIIVKEASPWCIMTAYNKVNGIHCSENRELLQDILRDEWGFDGLVMTDWWTSGEHYLETKAGNDLKMGSGYPERVMEAYEKGVITREEIMACVKRVLELILKME